MHKQAEFSAEKKPSMLDSYRVVETKDTDVKVGIVGTLGLSVVDDVAKSIIVANNEKEFEEKKNAYFGDNGAVLNAVLKEMESKKPDAKVLLYQGTEEEPNKLAAMIGELDVM